MDEYTNENEQWEAIKKGFRKHGLQVLMCLLVGLTVGFGWHYFQNQKTQTQAEASQLFDQLLSIQAQDPGSPMLTQVSHVILRDYGSTVYAPLALLFEAKSAVIQNNLPLAEQKLRLALTHSASYPELKIITQLRLTRLLLAEKKPGQALDLLIQIPKKAAFLGAIAQVQGDIYLAQGKLTAAKTAYQTALNALPLNEPIRASVAMKLAG